ncbi:MAG: hypothetical protein OEM22_08190, partial [Acidimicrobiia bacterium]|nr:hypothetical protein [Acidimicrobiia bacterium]
MDALEIGKLANDLLGTTGDWRLVAEGHSSTVVGRDGMVAKWHQLEDRALREITAYEHIGARVDRLLPELIAHSSPLLVLEDVGGGDSLADALLSSDRMSALRHLGAWTDAVGRLHEATWRNPDDPVDQSGHELLIQRAYEGVLSNPTLTSLRSWS